jgi:polyferredoxin
MAQKLTRTQMFKRVLRPRVLIYGTVLLAITAALFTSIGLRKPFRVDVVRDRNSLARIVDEGRIENVYRLQLMNATETTQHYRVKVEGFDGARIDGASEVEVGAAQARWFPVAVQVPYEVVRKIGSGAHPIRFEIERLSDDHAEVTEKSTFVVPR